MTDIDNVRVTGHGGAKQFAMKTMATVKTIQKLQAWKVVKNLDENTKFDYIMKVVDSSAVKSVSKDKVLD